MKFKRRILYILILLFISDASIIIGVEFKSELLTPIVLVAKFLAICYLISFAKKSNWEDDLNKTAAVLFKIMLFWNIITIVRGAISAHSYWDWRFLILTT